MKPEEYDVVQLLRPLPEHNLPAGARSAVVLDSTKYSDENHPPEYQVEFVGPDGFTQALVTIAEDDFEVVSRP
jgi:Domain of unknown function (DUF4926)